MYIFGSRALDLCRCRLRCGQTAEQTQATFAHETGGDEVGEQIQRNNGGEDVRERMAAREPSAVGQGAVWAASRDAHGGSEGRETEVGEVRQL